jgi:hypothetical protein
MGNKCWNMKKNATQFCKMLQQFYGEGTVRMKQVFLWVKQFWNRREDVTDERSGCPTT